jgi:peptidyl-prolyl cis-trans isomerase C
MISKLKFLILLISIGLMGLLFGCSAETPLPLAVTPSAEAPTAAETTEEATPTKIPLDPTATSLPLAASINGEIISLVFYESELSRFREVAGTGLATYGEEQVILELIDQVLLAQAATAAGFVVDDTLVDDHIQKLGLDNATLTVWMDANHYTLEDFFQAMRWSIGAAWMRDQIIAVVPDTAEQVHARQILLYNSDEADRVYAQLQSGADFETLAIEYDSLTGGDLGWFPQGYLFVPELEQVIFALNPGEYSPIVATFLGYHIAELIERDPNHPLTADTQRTVQIQAVQTWLTTRRSESEIIISLP